jgi:recombination protein RecA
MTKRAKKKGELAALGDPQQVISDLIKSINNTGDFGLATIRGKNSVKTHGDLPTTPSGSLALDIALGIGGYPRGRIIEIYGPESAGKTTLALHAIANCQAAGGLAAFIDAEHALDANYAQALGVDLDTLLLSQPSCGEEGLQLADQLVRTGKVDLIVVDSVAALVPAVELAGEMSDQQVGVQARMMSKFLRKITGGLNTHNASILFLNQLRTKIGVTFGSPETTSGGNALKFYASIRLDIRRIGAVKKGEDILGNRTRVKVVKNKMAAPYKKVEFDIIYGEGVDTLGELLDYGMSLDLVSKAGSWYTVGEKRAQGRDKARGLLRENRDLMEKIRAAILGMM